MVQGPPAGVTFVPGEAFYLNQPDSPYIRLCFVTHDEDRLTEGVRWLAKVLASGATNARPLI